MSVSGGRPAQVNHIDPFTNLDNYPLHLPSHHALYLMGEKERARHCGETALGVLMNAAWYGRMPSASHTYIYPETHTKTPHSPTHTHAQTLN